LSHKKNSHSLHHRKEGRVEEKEEKKERRARKKMRGRGESSRRKKRVGRGRREKEKKFSMASWNCRAGRLQGILKVTGLSTAALPYKIPWEKCPHVCPYNSHPP
jgi:hypothetical protein